MVVIISLTLTIVGNQAIEEIPEKLTTEGGNEPCAVHF